MRKNLLDSVIRIYPSRVASLGNTMLPGNPLRPVKLIKTLFHDNSKSCKVAW